MVLASLLFERLGGRCLGWDSCTDAVVYKVVGVFIIFLLVWFFFPSEITFIVSGEKQPFLYHHSSCPEQTS